MLNITSFQTLGEDHLHFHCLIESWLCQDWASASQILHRDWGYCSEASTHSRIQQIMTCRWKLWIAVFCLPCHFKARSCKPRWDPTLRLRGSQVSAKWSEFQGCRLTDSVQHAFCGCAARPRQNGSLVVSFKKCLLKLQFQDIDLVL